MPDFHPETGYLPPGIYVVPWAEIIARLAFNDRRRFLVNGLLRAVRNLVGAGCRSILLDGSFITNKLLPGDYDGAWNSVGVDANRLDPVLLDCTPSGRDAMKRKYGGELFPASAQAGGNTTFRDFFQADREGVPKGIIEIDLESLP